MARPFRLAALGDLHCREDEHGRFREVVKAVNDEAEGLVLCGDLTDRGVVDDGWFEHARRGDVMGVPVLLAPPEEIIWSKAYVCERERYDGNDVSHLVLACGDEMSWNRLVARFDEHWEVLLAHLLMFRFSFPSRRSKVPDWVMRELLRRTWEGMVEGDWNRRICRGPLLSKVQYCHLLEHLGYQDVRQDAPSDVRDEPGAREDRPPAGGGEDGAAVSPGSAG